jgi:hypothetical protein
MSGVSNAPRAPSLLTPSSASRLPAGIAARAFEKSAHSKAAPAEEEAERRAKSGPHKLDRALPFISGRIDSSLIGAALVVAVAAGELRLRSATEGGQCVDRTVNAVYLVRRQFPGADALQDSIVLIHSCLSFLFFELTIVFPRTGGGILQTSSAIPKKEHGSKSSSFC